MSRNTDDGLQLVYDVLKVDDLIRNYCYSVRDGLRIKFFEYPETADMTGNWIVLESIINELPSHLADDTWVTYEYLLHVEVWSRNRESNRMVARRVRDILKEEFNFIQNDSVDETDLGIYRDARRYKGVLHRSDLDNI